MQRYIKDLNVALQDSNADGVPEHVIVTYEIRDKDNKTARSNGRFELKPFNPFDTVVGMNQHVLEAVATRENIPLSPSSSSSSRHE